MTLEALAELLVGAGLDVQPGDILDALYLARHAPGLGGDAAAPAASAGIAPAPPEAARGTRANAAAPDRDAPRADKPEAEKMAPPAPAARSSLYAPGDVAAGEPTVAASPFAVPAGTALPERLALMRALRPLARRWPSRRARVIDEARTVEMSAQLSRRKSRAAFPVFRPRRERWYEVELIAEDDLAIEVWDETLRRFRGVLEQSGAFRAVRGWRLRLDAPDGGAMLERPGGRRIAASALTGDGARRLILFATHGASAHWHDGRHAALLARWQAQASLVLLHMLPRARWPLGALGEPHGLAYAEAPGVPAAALRVAPFWWLMSNADPAALVAVPAVPLEPHALADWAAMQMGGGRRTPVYLLDPAAQDVPPPAARNVERAVAQLRDASPEAYRLAVALSASSFTLPVARLVQEALLGGAAHPSELGELFLSGLVEPCDDRSGPIERRYFAFPEDVRTLLSGALSDQRARCLAATIERQVAAHITRAAGDGGASFSALTPSAGGRNALPAWAEPFASVARALAGATPEEAPAAWQQPAELPFALLLVAAFFARDEIFETRTLRAPVRTALAATGWFDVSETMWWRAQAGTAAMLAEAVRARVGSRRLLWVDDNPDQNRQVAERLADFGFVVDRETGTAGALNSASDSRYNLVVTDWSRAGDSDAALSLMDGLRRMKWTAPVIVFAGRFGTERIERALAHGGFAYTNNVADLLWLIGEALSNAHLFHDPAEVQRLLADRGLLDGGVDDPSGAATRAALNRFQSEGDLPETAWAGTATVALLTAGLAAPAAARTAEATTARIYRHGYGECTLVSLGGGASPYRLLVNCGLIVGTGERGLRLFRVIDDIARVTGGTVDSLVVTKASATAVDGLEEAKALRVEQLLLGWWEDERDALGAEVRRRGARGQSAAADRALQRARRRAGQVRFLSPGSPPVSLGDTGARLFAGGVPRDRAALARLGDRQPGLDVAIELATGEVMLFLAVSEVDFWADRAACRWTVGDTTVTGEALLARATFCSLRLTRGDAGPFARALRTWLPRLRLLSVPIDRTLAAQRGWQPPDLSALDEVLRARGGAVLVNDEAPPPMPGLVDIADGHFDVHFEDVSAF